MIQNEKNITYIGSFDIGKKNFAFCVEEVDISILNTIKKLQIHDRYNKDYSPTSQMKKDLEKVYKSGKIVLLKKINLTEGTDNKYFDIEYCHNMTEILDEHIEYWNKCSIIIIEEQMNFRGKCNTMALKLGQHCFSYFAINYKRFMSIIQFPAYHKTNVLGAIRKSTTTKTGKIKWKPLGDKERKQWAIVQAKDILTLRNDEETLELFKVKPKRKGITKLKLDDLSDTIVQLQAFKYLAFVAGEIK